MTLQVTMLRDVLYAGSVLANGSAQSLPDDVARQYIYEKRATLSGVDPQAGKSFATVTLNTDPGTGMVTALLAGNQTLYLASSAFTWATKPSAVGNQNQVIFISDVGYGGGSHWRSDGTYWRPVGGSVLLDMKSGSLASPVQSLTGNTGATFTAAQVAVPAGLLIPGAQIELLAHVRRVGANGSANFNGSIGTTGTASDANLFGFGMAATTNVDYAPAPMIDVVTATLINTTNWMQVAGPSGNSAAADTSANFNTAAAMTLSLYTSSANALDTFNLIKTRVRVHM